jgi:hypothetical protein
MSSTYTPAASVSACRSLGSAVRMSSPSPARHNISIRPRHGGHAADQAQPGELPPAAQRADHPGPRCTQPAITPHPAMTPTPVRHPARQVLPGQASHAASHLGESASPLPRRPAPSALSRSRHSCCRTSPRSPGTGRHVERLLHQTGMRDAPGPSKVACRIGTATTSGNPT